MLDIVQYFPLLSYCIVSPIYISPICNVEIHYSEKIKLGILYFSLFTYIYVMPKSFSAWLWVIDSRNAQVCFLFWLRL